jgi:hypothetical protein
VLPLVPPWLLADPVDRQEPLSLVKLPPGTKVPEGQRRNELFRIGCGMRGDGWDVNFIARELAIRNEYICDPPLPPGEVAYLAADICRRYPPG